MAPTRWFVLTAWMDALHATAGHVWITDSWYVVCELMNTSGLLELRCGAYVICVTDDPNVLARYETCHKRLRLRYANRELTKAITAQYAELRNAEQDINDRLQEFCDTNHLPGHCDLC